MTNNKEYNKSTYFDYHIPPKLNFIKRLSSDADKEIIEQQGGINSIIHKLRQIEKNKFKNIPKNERLMDFAGHNNDKFIFRRSDKDKTYHKKILNNIDQNEFEVRNLTNIKKHNDSSLKVSSLIPISKKKRNTQSRMKTIKEKDNLIINILKRTAKKKRRKYSCNDDKISKNSKVSKKKPLRQKYNSSHSLIKMKTHKKLSNNKLTDLNHFTVFLKKEEKTKKHPKKESNKNLSDKKKNNNDHVSINVYSNVRESKISGNKTNKNSNKKVNFDLSEHNTEKKKQVDVNATETKNECDLININNKNKKKKHRGFPFCCLTVKDSDSFEGD